MQFAQRLEQLLSVRKITPYRIRKDIGLSNSIVADWLSGKKLPSAENLIKLALYFDVSVDYLLGLNDKLTAGGHDEETKSYAAADGDDSKLSTAQKNFDAAVRQRKGEFESEGTQ